MKRTGFNRLTRVLVSLVAAALAFEGRTPRVRKPRPAAEVPEPDAAPVGRATTIARIVLIAFGVLLLLISVYLYQTTVGQRPLKGVLEWLIGAVIVHDAILSPLVFGVSLMVRRVGRRIPNVVLAIVQVAVIVGVIFTFFVVPEIVNQALGVQNPTVLPFNYGLRLAVMWVVIIALTVAACRLALRRQRRALALQPA